MSYYQDDGKKPVYKTTRGAKGSNWLFLLPVELVPLVVGLLRKLVR